MCLHTHHFAVQGNYACNSVKAKRLQLSITTGQATLKEKTEPARSGAV